jgi:hypothetical protein
VVDPRSGCLPGRSVYWTAPRRLASAPRHLIASVWLPAGGRAGAVAAGPGGLRQVDWSAEGPCFRGVARELARLFAYLPPPPVTSHSAQPAQPALLGTAASAAGVVAAGGTGGVPAAGTAAGAAPPASAGGVGEAGEDWLAEARQRVCHVLMPAVRAAVAAGAAADSPAAAAASSLARAFLPPRSFGSDSTVMQLACLENLYKVFERC